MLRRFLTSLRRPPGDSLCAWTVFVWRSMPSRLVRAPAEVNDLRPARVHGIVVSGVGSHLQHTALISCALGHGKSGVVIGAVTGWLPGRICCRSWQLFAGGGHEFVLGQLVLSVPSAGDQRHARAGQRMVWHTQGVPDSGMDLRRHAGVRRRSLISVGVVVGPVSLKRKS